MQHPHDYPHSQIHNSQPHGATPQINSYMGIKSHGKAVAIGFEPDKTRQGWFSARIESAKKVNPNSKEFAWKHKISIQLTKSELPIVIAVLLGYKKTCKFENHGEDNKWFEIINQGANFFVKMGSIGDKRMDVCPVSLVDAHLMGLLALTAHTKNFDGLTTDAALEAVKTLALHLNRNGS